MSLKHDQYFTPPEIIEDIRCILAERFAAKKFLDIADYAAGQGALLACAEEIFEYSNIHANDIDQRLCDHMNETFPHWNVHNYDFEIPDNLPYLPLADLIIMNPPFSKPDKRKFNTDLDGKSFVCSYSMLHLSHALSKLKNRGSIICILPSSVHSSEIDRNIWNYIKKTYSARIEKIYSSSTFSKCDATTVLVTLHNNQKYQGSTNLLRNVYSGISLVRGWQPMHSIHQSQTGYRLIHTTSLRADGMERLPLITSKRTLSGKHLLIPRVGRVSYDKIVIYESDVPFVLSDCVFSVQCDVLSLECLRDFIISDPEFVNIYNGTGAKYVSLEALKDYLYGVIQIITLSRENGDLPFEYRSFGN